MLEAASAQAKHIMFLSPFTQLPMRMGMHTNTYPIHIQDL